jgi:hypothetical protein
MNEWKIAQQKMKEKKEKGLKRNLSLLTITLEGHLFDTRCFNQVIDLCEKEGVQFRVLQIDLGQTNKTTSHISIQLMANDKTMMSEIMDKIEEIVASCKVELYVGGREQEDSSPTK